MAGPPGDELVSGVEEASLWRLGVAVGGKVQDDPLSDAPETLELGAGVAGEGVKLGVAVGGKVRDDPLSDEAPETLELGATVAGGGVELHKPRATPSGPQDSTGMEEVCREDESKPGDDGGGCDGDDEPCWLGVELDEVGQRPRDRPKGPQGSIDVEGDDAGAGEDERSVCEGTDGWGPMQTPSTMTEGDEQTTCEDDGVGVGVGVGMFDDAGGG